MHGYDGHFGGMHYIWWIVWLILLVWIFILPYNIPFQKSQKDSPLDILKKRYARGEISKDEYEEARKTLNSDR
ncbi:putative membrane protein [Pricia antarctica]|uniref:Putative membrane protein n=2 Tax=Pricia antarctica TaxID=641691 RepID=A0A1G7CWA7_9FLAO|nr:putative membrane protein [Pricia antarctica]